MYSCNSHVSYFQTTIDSYASTPSSTPHPARPCAHPALWSRPSQHNSSFDTHAFAGQCRGEPPRPIWRRGHGKRLVRRMEAGLGGNFVRFDRRRLLLTHWPTHARAVSHFGHPLGIVRFCRTPDLLVQCRSTSRAREPASFRIELPLTGDQRPLRHLSLRLRRQDTGC